MFESAIFNRGADLRGTYPRDINEEVAWFAGQTLVQFLRKRLGVESPRIIVGRDGRVSSPAIYRALIEGIAARGGVAIPCGLASTDLVQWGVGEQVGGAVAGTMVTASHNPAEYNGLKSVVLNTERNVLDPIRPNTDLRPCLAEIAGLPSASTAGVAPFPEGTGNELRSQFVAAACTQAPRLSEATGKIVLDPGNGAAAIFLTPLKAELERLGANVEVEAIAAEIDGTFPTRPSNPGLPGAVKGLQAAVVKTGAAFGVAFDGDADRAFMVDEKGEFVPGSQMLAALADAAIRQKKAAGIERCPVVIPAVCSWKVIETIRAAGGIPVMSRVGQDSLRTAAMQTGAVFAGESSAHFNFPDTYMLDSGLFATMTFWNLLIESGKTASELLSDFAIWPASGETNLRIESDRWSEISRIIIGTLVETYGSAERNCFVLPLDGVGVYSTGTSGSESDVFTEDGEFGSVYRVIADGYTPDWMFNVRASNNEPLLRLNVESQVADQVPTILEELINTVEQICRKEGASVSRDD